MNPYPLGKLVELAGTLTSRKRIQKVVHLLKAAGYQVDADYRLHYYGPYSDDVASVLNQLVQSDLLIETEFPTGGSGRQFKYQLSDHGARSLEEFEKTPDGKAASEEIAAHEPLLRNLLKTGLTELELASTIVFNRQTGKDWDEAIDDTCSFKHVERTSPVLGVAVQLARKIVA